MITTLRNSVASTALKTAALAVAGKTTLPILSNVLITANHRVTFSATDLDTAIEASMDAAIEAEGVCCVPEGVLSDLLSGIDGAAEVNLRLDESGKRVEIKAGRSVYRLPALPGEQYPSLPEVAGEGAVTLTLPLGELREAIRRVSFACLTKDATRPTLAGVCWQVTPEGSTLVATDTHRLAVLKHPTNANGAGSFLIPKRCLDVVRNLPGGDEDEAIVALTPDLVQFRAGDWVITNRLTSGAFPKWERILPESHSVVWRVQTAEFASALRRIRVVAAAQEKGEIIAVGPAGGSLIDTLRLKSLGADTGDGEEEVAFEADGDPIRIGLNARYLLDICGACEETMEIRMTDPLSPAVVVSGDNWQCVLMPVDLGNGSLK